MKILNTILDIVFPRKCAYCRRPGSFFCEDCISSTELCSRDTPKWVFPLYDYRDQKIKKAIHAFKYKSKRDMSSIFAQAIHDNMMEELYDMDTFQGFRDPILVPIPISPKRRRQRGFNQASLICKELQKLSPELFGFEEEVLIKPKDTKHQADIKNRNQRLRNVIGTFTIKNDKKIKGRNVILIDDVTTTGATLKEARKLLKSAGAKKIIAFTIAH